MKENVFTAKQQIKFENLVSKLSETTEFRGNRKAVIRYLVELGVEPATLAK